MDRLPDGIMRNIATRLGVFRDPDPERDFKPRYELLAPARLVCKNWAAAILEGVPQLHISKRLLPSLAGKFAGVRALTWESCVTSRADRVFFPPSSRIKYLRFVDKKTNWKCRQITAAFPEVETLVFNNCLINSLSRFAAMTSLTTLVVIQTPVYTNYHGIEHLSSLTSLTIDDPDRFFLPSGVTRLSRLASLNLTGCCEIEDAKGIVNIASLRYLDISDTCAQIDGLPDALDTLIMHEACEWPTGLFADNMRRSLNTLSIIERDSTAEVFDVEDRFRPIGTLLALTTLRISSSAFTRSDANELGNLRALVSLDLSDSGGGAFIDPVDVYVGDLGNLQSLETLDVSYCDIFVPEDFAVFGRLTGLKTLRIMSRLRDVINTSDTESDEGENVGAALGHLTGEVLGHLSALPLLEHIDAAGCLIEDDGLARLAEFPSLKCVNIATEKRDKYSQEALMALKIAKPMLVVCEIM